MSSIKIHIIKQPPKIDVYLNDRKIFDKNNDGIYQVENLHYGVHKLKIVKKVSENKSAFPKLSSYKEGFYDNSKVSFLRLKYNLEEIAKELGVEKEEVVMCLDAIQDPMSLQEPVYNDGSESIYVMDQVKDTKNTEEQWSNNITISEAFKKLNDREKMIIGRRFFAGKTQMEVADEIGISQAQVSRLEKDAINNVKKLIK